MKRVVRSRRRDIANHELARVKVFIPYAIEAGAGEVQARREGGDARVVVLLSFRSSEFQEVHI